MRRGALVLAAAVLLSLSGVSLADERSDKPLSTAEIKQRLIAESIAAYSGNCPCPYSRASNGSRCGRRSAYSRPGGEAPLCYVKDITSEMVEAYRARSSGD